ncbi:MAG: CubicO group peptidase (beta-lactamase class C family) [Verrucomicrobiales bacterium]|jgi:CubicO group peptidase (beta-lactamase class C family)
MHRTFFIFLATCTQVLASPLPRSSAESQGVRSSAVQTFLEAANKHEAIHSFMLMRHGHVIAETWWAPFKPEAKHKLYSLSKSFTSTAVGMAIADGKLSLDDTIISFFPQDAPAKTSNNLSNMRVRDLLSMSTGHVSEDLNSFSFQAEERLTKAFLALPVKHKPGTHFHYNTPATYMCSAIVQKVTGESVLEYLGPRLFEPLGIEGATWETCPQGVSLGGFGLSVRTEDIAKLGQLYLQRGEWEGKRLLPASWVDAATAKQTSNGSNPMSDWDQGYGYQFWQCRHGAYRGDGAFGQYCIVLPELDAVIAITSGTNDMQGVMNLVWDHLLPAMSPVPLTTESLPNPPSYKLPMPEGSGQPSGVGTRFVFAKNPQGLESLHLKSEEDSTLLTAVANGEESHVAFGHQKWDEGKTAFGPSLKSRGLNNPTEPIGASGAWTEDGTFTGKIWYTETPYALTLTLRFGENDSLIVDPVWNVGFGPKKGESLKGSAEK